MTGGLLLATAIDSVAASAQARRAQAVDSVSELAVRLQEARRDQGAAERRAAAAEARASALQVELLRMQRAWIEERALTDDLRALIGC
ncbi:hypothetical protein [Methylobacterium sp. CG08_land_8_20_14_0_20_71_15]|uniref:hypothetical protein n=1 Tax=Methylobacterium sp. CG08_land_8_20_14_0_20_71_15 TaxID=1975531 RepID=UPI002580AD6D|nr:hypothetical protein [Methylobacterium sp. CG08_land_8_20_14_0_20_71_15]